jgi:hypothetical protein
MEDAFDIPSLPLGTYRHYKGNVYEVIGVGCHSETHEYLVVYRPLFDHEGKPDIWIRPYTMFIEDVEINGAKVPRFRKIEG